MTARWWRRRARTGLDLVPTCKESPSVRRTAVRRAIGGLSLLLVVFQVGCYSYLPMQTEVPRSPNVMVQLNDRGRVDVSAGMGPNVEAIEGIVAGADSATVRLKVSRVVYSRGGSSIWTGEEVSIARAGVSGFRARQFSKGRTWTLAGLVAAVVVISVLTVDLDLFNNEADPDRCIGPSCGTNPSVRQ
jgi:hypothetical protein